MTDTSYLMQYFLEHSPKDNNPQSKVVQTAKNIGKLRKEDDEDDKRDSLSR